MTCPNRQLLLLSLPGRKTGGGFSPQLAEVPEPRELVELRSAAQRFDLSLRRVKTVTEAERVLEHEPVALVLVWFDGTEADIATHLSPLVRRWSTVPLFVWGEDRARPAQAALRAGAWGYLSSVYEFEDVQRVLVSLREDETAPRPDELTLEAAERFAIKRALLVSAGNVKRAAKTLGIARATLYRKMSRFGLRS